MKSTTSGGVVPLTSLNHISLVCRSVERLFDYGMGIHLLQSEDPEGMPNKSEINPKDNHISFQCDSTATVERKLREMGIPCIQRTVEEGGISVDHLLFHGPDGFMIEVCNCEVLPVVPLCGGEPVWVCKRATATPTEEPPQPQ